MFGNQGKNQLMSQWYYAHDNQQQGPVNEVELKEFIATGKISPTTLVWHEGMENWATADSVPEFQFRPPPVPASSGFALKVKPPEVTAPARFPAPTPAPAAAQSAPAAGAAASTAEPDAAAPIAEDDPADIQQNKPLALLSYAPGLFIIPMNAAKDSPFAKYHANQGLVLFIAMITLWVAIGVVSAIPFVNLITFVLWPLFPAVWLVFAVMGVLNAAKGVRKPLPFIGQYTIYS